MGRRYDTISFLSDLGTTDELVGVVKSVLRDMAPHAYVLDLTHEIPPFDVRAGSLALARAIPYVPAGVVLAVVDPGVGTARRAVALEVGDGAGVMLGPDNGLLAAGVALAGGAGRSVVLSREEHHLAAPGSTFSARDIFAPVAAHLCNGVDLAELGEAIEPDVLLPGIVPLPREEAGALACEVLWVDRFGNCQLNIGPDEVASWGDRLRVTINETVRSVTIVGSFGEIGAGALGLVLDAYGMLALAVDRGSAADELALGPGDQIVVGPPRDGDGGGRGVTTPVSLRLPR